MKAKIKLNFWKNHLVCRCVCVQTPIYYYKSVVQSSLYILSYFLTDDCSPLQFHAADLPAETDQPPPSCDRLNWPQLPPSLFEITQISKHIMCTKLWCKISAFFEKCRISVLCIKFRCKGTHWEKDRDTDRQTNRKTDTDKQQTDTDKQTHREMDRQMDVPQHRWTDRQMGQQIGRGANNQTDRRTNRHMAH